MAEETHGKDSERDCAVGHLDVGADEGPPRLEQARKPAGIVLDFRRVEEHAYPIAQISQPGCPARIGRAGGHEVPVPEHGSWENGRERPCRRIADPIVVIASNATGGPKAGSRDCGMTWRRGRTTFG